MADRGKATATPRLRFPEFRYAGAWNAQKLGVLVDTIVPPAKLPTSSYMATGAFPIIDQSQEAICGWTDDEQAVVKGPLPLIVFGDHTCVVKFVARPFAQGADGIKILAAKPVVSADYLFHSLNHQPLVMEEYKRHFSALKERQVFLPTIESGEQQKITDCLTSLDEVIAAQGRKVEALKTHKRGLMQQLFPRAGETRPRLRFPEFRNAPDWEVREVGDVFRVTRGQVLAMPLIRDRPSREAPYPVYSSQTKSRGLAGYFDSFLYQDAITWTTDGANAGEVNYREGKFYCTNVCGVLLSDEGYANPCVAGLLNTVTRSHVSYVGNPKLMNGVMAKISIPFPSVEEQHRIASCLSSLDAQITAETAQLAALTTHKRGLMQQLFPQPEAVA